MIQPYLFFVSIFIICTAKPYGIKYNVQQHKESNIAVNENIHPADSLTWITHFREFRTAVYQHDKSKTKTFIDFPIINDNNEIWWLVKDGNDKAVKMLSEKIKPFTEKDFDLYFDKLFSKDFVNALLKVKTDELYRKGETETIELKDGKDTSYKIYASFNNAEKKLDLNLSSKTVVKDKDGEVMDGGESSVNYQFNILNNGQIKFKQVRIAG